MNESGPINKGKYWRTEFEGLKDSETIEYNNEMPNFRQMEYFLVRRFSDEDENQEGLTFIGKDHVVMVEVLNASKVQFMSEYSRSVYIDEDGVESYDPWYEDFNVDVSGSYMNEYEYEDATPRFTFTKAEVNSGIDDDGTKFEIYRLDRRPEVMEHHITSPEMQNLRQQIVNEAEGNIPAAVSRIQNIMAGQAHARRVHALKFFNKTMKNRIAAAQAARTNKGGRRKTKRTLKKRHTKSRRNGLRRL